jgi:hypothetical protein
VEENIGQLSARFWWTIAVLFIKKDSVAAETFRAKEIFIVQIRIARFLKRELEKTQKREHWSASLVRTIVAVRSLCRKN